MYETPLPLDYVTKDYEGFYQFMKGLIPTLLPEWTDYSESDFGIVLLQLAAYGLHILSYYQDKGFNENILYTAKNRESVILLCRFLGYELAPQEAATTTVTFTKYADKLNTEVTIPAGTKVSTNPKLGDVIYFETDADLVIAAGSLSGSTSVTHGYSYPDEIIGIGNGIVDQEIIIAKENVLINDMEIYTIENNIKRTWTKVDDFIDSISTDRHYLATIESTGYTKITFGDGTFGMKVPASTPIYGTYRLGGGLSGNVGAGKLSYLYDSITDIETVTNALAATGGLDMEATRVAKMKAPKRYKTMNRAVTKNDFEAIAETIPGVAKAKCVETYNINGDVYLYIVPSDYGVPSTTLLNTIKTSIEELMVLNCNLSVFPTTYIDYFVNISVEISSEYSNAAKKTEIEAYLATVLHPDNYEHGEDISDSYILGSVHRVAGVKKVSISSYVLGATPSDGLYCTDTEFLLPNNFALGSTTFEAVTVTVTGGI